MLPYSSSQLRQIRRHIMRIAADHAISVMLRVHGRTNELCSIWLKKSCVMPRSLYGLQNHLRNFSFLKPLSLLHTSDLHTQVKLCQHFCHNNVFHPDLWKCKRTNFKLFIYVLCFAELES
jgi:hypothetical protein